jgi:hypothetical protein
MRTHLTHRRLIVATSLLAAAAFVPGTASAGSWADDSIRTVLGRQLLPGVTPASFRPQGAVSVPLLHALAGGALPGGQPLARSGASSPGYVTLGALNSAFVHRAGLGPAAADARASLARVGYRPRRGAGAEIAARILGLRYNHPDGQDALEHAPGELATRAEAAYTTAKVLRWSGWEVGYAAGIMARLRGLPVVRGERFRALNRGVRLLGQPYVWGGEWETVNGPLGPQAHGGFDCSGFLWRILALDRAAPRGMAARLGGRSTFSIAAVGRRLRRAAIRPGDIIFFGSAGPRSRPAQIYHAGIDLGNGLMIHSSTQGVHIGRWDEGYHASVFAWGRSVLPA